jgi:hypothetical protein
MGASAAANSKNQAMAKGRTPDGRQSFVDLEHVGDLDDALGSVGAPPLIVEPAELIIVQAANRERDLDCQMQRAVMGC